MGAQTEGPRFSFDPDRCTVWTTFAEIKAGDWIDYWGPSRKVVEWLDFPLTGQVRVIVDNGVGRDLALVPATEGTYRERREDELEPCAAAHRCPACSETARDARSEPRGPYCGCADPQCPTPDGEYTHG